MKKNLLRTGVACALSAVLALCAAAKKPKNFRMMPKRAPAAAEAEPAAARGEPLRVMAGRWTPEVRAALDRFIAERGRGSDGYDAGKPPVAVLPWSDAMVVGDPAELVFLGLTSQAAFEFNDDWWDIVPIAYGRQPARAAYEGFVQLSSAAWPSLPDYNRYRKTILASYIGLCRGVGRRECRQYLMRVWAGWKEDAADAFSRRILKQEKARPGGIELVRAEEADAAPLRLRRGLRLIPEMRDVAAKLRAAGVDIWVVDDVPQPVLAAAAADYGIEPSRVVGVRAVVSSGTFSAAVLKPVPTRGGKAEIVKAALGRPADLVIGRDAADADLMSYGDGLRIALAGDPALEAKARSNGWLLQPSLAH